MGFSFMDNQTYKLSDRVTVVFEAMPAGYYYPKVVVDGESMKIPLIFYPEMGGVEPWLKAIEGLDEPLGLSRDIVAGALSYAMKHPN
jgi:hypothetical protein